MAQPAAARRVDVAALFDALLRNVERVIQGKREQVSLALVCLLAEGHLLVEDVPGVGKTSLAKAIARSIAATCNRIQFTPDLLPSDVTGVSVWDRTRGDFEFRPGGVFANVVLADEINRASPKTQAALLEAMGEGAVTLFGETRRLERPFFVLATQNPIEMEGTNPLPEAQLDRFAIKVDVPPTDEGPLLRMLMERKDGTPPLPAALADRDATLAWQRRVDDVFLPEAVATLIARLVARATPSHPEAFERVKTAVRYGPSPRAAIWLARLGRALALIEGRAGVAFEDIRAAAPFVLGHRLILTYGARLDGTKAVDLAVEIHREAERDLLGDSASLLLAGRA